MNDRLRLTIPGVPSILHISDRQLDPLVHGSVLLLCRCYLPYLSLQYHEYDSRDQISKSLLRLFGLF